MKKDSIPDTQPSPKSHIRFIILGLIFICVIINYVHRNCLAVVADDIMADFEISPVKMGVIFSAFGWTYAWLQIPGGLIVDLIRPRLLYTILLAGWSVAAICQGLAQSFMMLIGCRMSIGVFQAPSYPCKNRIVTSWFPDNERAFAIAFYTSGQFIGLAIATPILLWLQTLIGWRNMLLAVGAAGLLWVVVWYLCYRDPQDHPRVTQSELDHIAQGGGLVSDHHKESTKRKFTWADFRKPFQYRKLWGVYLGQFCMGGIFLFFLTWFPTYLKRSRGFDFKNSESGLIAAIPFLAACVGVLVSGAFSDFLKRKGFSTGFSRKLPVISGLLLSASIVGADYMESTSGMMFFLCLAFFGNGLASIAWIFVSEIAPKNLLGLVGGVFNFIGNLSGIIIPIVMGMLIIEEDGVMDFKWALAFVAALALLGIFFYTVIVGKVERIELPETSA